MAKIERALISVSDKEGIVDFSRSLTEKGVEILSTGGTAKLLKENGIAVTMVSDHTGFPEIMDGRVKTLHPKIHGGILGRRDLPAHMDAMKEHGIKPIDMVVVNLYPFEKTISKEDCTLAEAIENIDIGGPSMVRSAAKNYKDVLIVVEPADYGDILKEIDSGEVSQDTRMKLSAKAYAHTSGYDALITSYLSNQQQSDKYPPVLSGSFEKVMDLRYGENPHQSAAFYKSKGCSGGIPDAEQLNGKELSYNNILDLAGTVDLVSEFEEPTAVIIKHTNPCGAASNDSLLEAYKEARETDPVSAFGGIVGFNRTVDAATATEMAATFLEVIVAPAYDPEALEILKGKKNLRIMKMPIPLQLSGKRYDLRTVAGGALYQENDSILLNKSDLKVVTKIAPTDAQMAGLMFAWKVAKHVKSNAIIFADEKKLIAVGAGQMSRVDSSKIAVSKATRPVKGTSMASDAFFPFRDGIDAAAAAGVASIIQPGGSIRDNEVIEAADELGLSMVFTGMRHFRH